MRKNDDKHNCEKNATKKIFVATEGTDPILFTQKSQQLSYNDLT
jgi:hypothetical protein